MINRIPPIRLPIVIILVIISIYSSLIANADYYNINDLASPNLRGENAKTLVQQYLHTNPTLKERLTNSNYKIPEADWNYDDQIYKYEDTMLHLLALQIKKMAEISEITSLEEAFDPKYGIGSKDHKDKGTIGNVFSIFGHPVREEILQGSEASVMTVYTLFRKTIKNQLKAFARSQTLDWHLQNIETKKTDTLKYLKKKYPLETNTLQTELNKIGLSFEILIERAIKSNLLS